MPNRLLPCELRHCVSNSGDDWGWMSGEVWGSSPRTEKVRRLWRWARMGARSQASGIGRGRAKDEQRVGVGPPPPRRLLISPHFVAAECNVSPARDARKALEASERWQAPSNVASCGRQARDVSGRTVRAMARGAPRSGRGQAASVWQGGLEGVGQRAARARHVQMADGSISWRWRERGKMGVWQA